VHDFDNFKKYDESNDEVIKEALDKHLKGNTSNFESEFKITKHNKAPSWILFRGKVTRQLENGQPVRASGTILDISQRKRYEQAILKNATIMEKAESVAKIGSFEWDFQENTIIISDQYCKIFNVEKDKVIPASEIFYSRVHPDDSSFLKELLRNKKNSYNVEHRLIMPITKEIKVIKNIGSIERNKKGKISKIIGVVQDITLQREVKKSIFNAEKNERRRIARDIHDGIGQMLVATKFKLAAINGQGTQEMNIKVDEVEDLMGTIIEEIRRVSRNLSNRYVEEFGIKIALNYLIEEIIALEQFEVIHAVDIPDNYDEDISNTLYRITQEAINNVVKYSKAKNVDINIQKVNQNLILEVNDDGIGFDTNKSSNGIKNMQERASLHNGHFEIKSVLNKGTKLKAWFPLT